MSLLTSFLPPWLNPTLLGIVGAAVISGAAGAYVAHKLDQIPLSEARAETASIQSQYDGYKAKVATDIATANAKAASDRAAQDARENDLQDQLIQAEKDRDAKSNQLKAILDKAAPQDVRAIGPVSAAYYDGLRAAQAAGHSASSRNP